MTISVVDHLTVRAGVVVFATSANELTAVLDDDAHATTSSPSGWSNPLLLRGGPVEHLRYERETDPLPSRRCLAVAELAEVPGGASRELSRGVAAARGGWIGHNAVRSPVHAQSVVPTDPSSQGPMG